MKRLKLLHSGFMLLVTIFIAAFLLTLFTSFAAGGIRLYLRSRLVPYLMSIE
ncbi:MAG: hypothetical protein V9G20_27355 [Candidatus Promineifilaceae bacterium]